MNVWGVACTWFRTGGTKYQPLWFFSAENPRDPQIMRDLSIAVFRFAPCRQNAHSMTSFSTVQLRREIINNRIRDKQLSVFCSSWRHAVQCTCHNHAQRFNCVDKLPPEYVIRSWFFVRPEQSELPQFTTVLTDTEITPPPPLRSSQRANVCTFPSCNRNL